MSAGTITLTNNSAAVSGTGTAFTTDLKAGDFIVSVVGGVTYTLPVKTVNSATGVTLLKNYDGPTQAGAAWSAVPRDTMNAITAQLAAETAQALRGLNYDKQNWQQVFSGSGTITVKLPDGSTFTGPAWSSITSQLSNKADKVSGAVPINQGGTGSTTASAARTSLGLGSAATLNTGDGAGSVLTRSAGIRDSSRTGDASIFAFMARLGFGSYRFDGDTSGVIKRYSTGFYSFAGDSHAFLQVEYGTGNVLSIGALGTVETGITLKSNTLWGTANTTVDASGFVKKASPIVNIFHDGTFDTNDESEGAQVSREDVGVYRISNVLGMNSDRAWGGNDGGFEIPKDRNGQRLLWLDYEIDPDGSILVKTYHRTYPNAPKFARNERGDVKEAEPVDIPADQFLSVRVEMPQDSVWNLAQKAAQEEMAQEEIAEE